MTELRGERALLRPLREEDTERLREIRAEPEVLKWWGPLEEGFPVSDEPTATRYTIVLGDDVAGMVQYAEEKEPDYRHVDVDIFIATPHHGTGLGTDALTTIVRHLVEDRGHHRVTLETAVDNERAQRSYEKAGFRRIGVMHKASWNAMTGRWDDELAMELVTGQPGPPATG